MKGKQRIAIILPMYNEASIIAQSFDTLLSFVIAQDQYAWEVVFVDDGSTDKTIHVLGQKMAQDVPPHVQCTLLIHEENKGKGAALQTGLRHAKADIFGYMDADLSISFAPALPNVFATLQHADVVIGHRTSRADQYNIARRCSSWLFGFVGRFLFRVPFHDIQCGFKWMTEKGKAQALAVEQARFSFDLEFLVRAKRKDLSIEEVSVDWQHTQQTSVALRDGVRYILDLFSIIEVAFPARVCTWLYAISAAVVVGLVFGWVVPYGYFFSDDFTWLWHGERIARGELQILTAHMSTFYSPVLNTFYAVLVRAVGVVPWVYFLIGLCIHAANALLAGILTRKITQSAAAGLLATLLTAVAAGAYEPLVWIGANMHSIVAMFMLASTIFLISAYQQTKRRVRYLLGSLVFALLAFGTKEIALALPLILAAVGLWYHVTEKKYMWSASRAWYWILGIGISALYVLKQYLAQSGSVWVSSGAFHFEPKFILRLPIALLDIIIPIGPIVNEKAAIPLLLFALGFFFYFLKRGKKQQAVWFGLFWSAVSVLPVLFFQAQYWWDVLASRYTYTSRIGMCIAIAALLVSLLREGRYVRLALRFFWILFFAAVIHMVIMGKIVTTNYSYVYQSGRSLHAAAEQVNSLQPERVYVNWFRPFTRNHAHVVGVLDVVAGIPEENIVFMGNETDDAQLGGRDVELKWNDERMEYIVIQGSG